MIYCFDLDGTLCTQTEGGRYKEARPILEAIAEVNRLYDAGHHIIVATARGGTSKIDWHPDTESQLASWGLKYHELHVGKKIGADIFIDDRAINAIEWRQKLRQKKTIGFLCGAFDLLHPGYIAAFQEAKMHCDHLVVGLHIDPSHERSQKIPPVVSVMLRERALRECRSVDDVFTYETEVDLVELLRKVKPEIRFLGDDSRGKPPTGAELNIPIMYLDRSHGFSMTEVKKKIAAGMQRYQE